VKLKEVGRIKRGDLEKGYIQFQLQAQQAEERVVELEGQLKKAKDTLEKRENQNIVQGMLLEERKALLESAQLALIECEERSKSLEQELVLLKRQMEYIHFRVEKGFFRKGKFDGYLKDFFQEI
jgi:hypothetical protein